jgi:regulator of protease activity HflC (stomatin/prohibitin superfamily)
MKLRQVTFVLGILLTSVLLAGCAGCTRIDAGHVGIVVNLAGDQRGVSDLPTTTGWTTYNPFTQQVYEYPTFVQTAIWTRSAEEGSPSNEEISFNCKDGLNITADISFSYQLAADKVPHFYVKFRIDDLYKFTHSFLRNIARENFTKVAGRYTAEEVYATKTAQFVDSVRAGINAELNPYGVTVEQFGFVGAPRPPQGVVDAINAKVVATQKAIQIENELRQAQGEAQKTVAKAEGQAKSQIAAARGEAEANRILVASITPQLIQWRQLSINEQWISRWNGQQPSVVTGDGRGMIYQLPQK